LVQREMEKSSPAGGPFKPGFGLSGDINTLQTKSSEQR